jgi:hypothetical protein
MDQQTSSSAKKDHEDCAYGIWDIAQPTIYGAGAGRFHSSGTDYS